MVEDISKLRHRLTCVSWCLSLCTSEWSRRYWQGVFDVLNKKLDRLAAER